MNEQDFARIGRAFYYGGSSGAQRAITRIREQRAPSLDRYEGRWWETLQLFRPISPSVEILRDTLQRLKPRSFYSTLALADVRNGHKQRRYVMLYRCVPPGST